MLTPTLQEWNAKCESVKGEILSPIDFKVAELKAREESLVRNRDEHTREERIQMYLNQCVESIQRKDRRILGRRRNHQSLTEELAEITQDIAQEESEQNDLVKSKYHQVRPKKRLTDINGIYVFCCV